jgi:hypothetical protein
MPTNYDLRPNAEVFSFGANCFQPRVVYKYRLDCATNPTTANSDVVIFGNLPAGFVYEGHAVHLITAEGSTCTAHLGLYANAAGFTPTDADGFAVSIDLNGTPGWFQDTTVQSSATPPISDPAYCVPGGKLITADACVGAIILNTADAAVADIYIYGTLLQ